MADNKRRGKFGKSSEDASQSIFDLFEPPPEQEASSFGPIPIIRDDEEDDDGDALDLTEVEMVEAQAAAEAEAAGLQHWTEPATGQIPAALGAEAAERANELEGPSWRGDDPNWSGPDLSDVFADTDAVNIGGLRGGSEQDLLDPLPAPPPRRPPTPRDPAARRGAPGGGDAPQPRKTPEPSLFDRPPGGVAPAPNRPERGPAGAPPAPGPDADGPRRGRSPLADQPPPAPSRAPGARPSRDRQAPAARSTPPAPGPASERGPDRPAPRRSALGGEPDRGAHDAPARTAPTVRREAPGAETTAGRLLESPSPSSSRPGPDRTGPGPDRGAPAPPPGPSARSRAAEPPGPSARSRAAEAPGSSARSRAAEAPGPSAERRLEGLSLDRLPPAPGSSPAPAPTPAPGPRPRSPLSGRGPDAPTADRLPDAPAPQREAGLDLSAPGPRRRAPGPADIGDDGLARRRPGPKLDALPDDYPEYDDFDDEFLDSEPSGSRSFGQRVLVGIALAALVFTALGVGPLPTMLLIGLLTLLAVMELFNAMRIAGLRPATLLGLVGAVAIPASTYVRGDTAYPLVVGLAVVFGMLWYLTGADTERPVLNLGLTLTGILWVGGLAGFAALMLREEQGTHLLLATILITATSDTLAYLGGRAYGTKPFHVASPNKTWEGTLTGFFGALFAGLAIGVTNLIGIFDVDGGFTVVMVLALVVGILAPIGDLAESLVKRDLGIKDMGTLLPGHGGVLDRVDGLLFALPGAYYVAVVYQLF